MISLAIPLFLALLLNACSTISQRPVEEYQLAIMQQQKQPKNWYFEGRLALIDSKDSVTASINWRHQAELDRIELAGPFSQGRVAITVSPDLVIVDDGEKLQKLQGQVEDVMREQFGVSFPLDALKYWVLGVCDPQQAHTDTGLGFIQANWQVFYREMQRVNAELLPKKISAEKESTSIKLVIDRWDLS